MTLANQTPTTDVYNVRDMGCKGDSVTDDRPILQQIINTVIAAGGGTIFFPPGNYMLSRAGANAFSLQLASGASKLTFLGIKGESFIKALPGQPNAANTLLKCLLSTELTFDGMGFDGNWGNATALIATTSDSVALPAATINVMNTPGSLGNPTDDFPGGPGTFSIITAGGTSKQDITYTAKTATSFTGCAGGAGTISFGDIVGYISTQNGINHTTQVDPQNHGLTLSGCTNVTIRNCMFRQIYGDMVWIGHSTTNSNLASSNIKLIGADLYIGARQGISIAGTSNGVDATDCQIVYPWLHGLDTETVISAFSASTDVSLESCYFGGWWDPISRATDTAGVRIAGGSAFSPAAFARKYRVHDCTIYNGVFIFFADDVVVSDCRIIDNHTTEIGEQIGPVFLRGYCNNIRIVDNWIYDIGTTAGVPGASQHDASIQISFDVPAGALARHQAGAVLVSGNEIYSRNGRIGILVSGNGGESFFNGANNVLQPPVTGVATAIAANTMTDGLAAWTVNQWAGWKVRLGSILAGIVSNTATVLTLDTGVGGIAGGWQSTQGQPQPTPVAGAYTIYQTTGLVEICDNEINCADDGYGAGGFGIHITPTHGTFSTAGMRVSIHDNTIVDANVDAIHVAFVATAPMQQLQIYDNTGYDDQLVATCTNFLNLTGTPNAVQLLLRNNQKGDGIANSIAGIATGTWLINGSGGGPQQWAGFGSPEGVVVARIGSIYQRRDGGAETSFYVKTANDTTAVGWVGIFPTGTVATVNNAASPYTVLSSDAILFVDTSGGAVSLNLPAPATQPAVNSLRIVDSTGNFAVNNCTLVRNAAEKIDGLAASKVLQTAWGQYVVVTNLTDWFV